MREAVGEGRCEKCGSTKGPFWKPFTNVLDFGVESMAPWEPNPIGPTLCDRCEYADEVEV